MADGLIGAVTALAGLTLVCISFTIVGLAFFYGKTMEPSGVVAVIVRAFCGGRSERSC